MHGLVDALIQTAYFGSWRKSRNTRDLRRLGTEGLIATFVHMKSLAFMRSWRIRIRRLSGSTKPFGVEVACTTYGRIPDSIPSTPILASRNS